ncbi:MAG: restriction endonuclease subunit S [Candidatus Paracaedibacter sp.]
MSSEWISTVYGRLPAYLQRASLANLCEKAGVQTGPFGSQLHKKDYVSDGTPIITVEHLGENRIIHENLPRVSDEDKLRLSKYLLRAGDIVFSRVGSVDRRALVQSKEAGWLFSGRCLRVRPKAELIDSRWLSYFFGMKNFKDYIRSIAVGATMPSINTKILSDVPIFFPSLKIQKEAANFLVALDDRITLLCETNVTLEAIAQALFKSWFVDFDPVHAKAEGRQPEGIDAETAALFPDSFEESELGLMPKGWRVGIVADLGAVICGKTPPTSNSENYGSDVPFITIPDMHGVLTVTSSLRKLSHQGANTQKNKYLRAGSICVSCIATAGLVVLVTEKAQTNQQINSVIPSDKWGDSFPLFLLRRIGDQVRAGGSGGSVFHNLNKTRFEQIRVLLPEPKLTQLFDYFVGSLIEGIILNQKQAQTLASLRDTLLPRLISGQLRLPETETLMGSAE